MNTEIYKGLCAIVGEENILCDEPLKAHTTFRIGGPADFLIRPETTEQIQAALSFCREKELPYFILGNGSNLLVDDAGYRGVIIQLYQNFQYMTIDGTQLRAGSGCLLSQLAAAALRESLTGMEFASGIPGTLGGGVRMNAGAYGGELKDIVTEVTVLDRDGNLLTLPVEKLEMGYRTSLIETEGWIVTEAVISLKKGDAEAIRARMDELKTARTTKQPLEYPSAGSTFKRPKGYFAGKLIQDAGLKGFTVGGAQVSEKHSGFVINIGDATSADVHELIRQVKEKVWEEFRVELTPEVRFL